MQNYNFGYDPIDTSTDSPGLIEPVTVTEVKNYARLTDFTDDLDSTSTVSFDTDDDLIEELITSAREWLEKFTGLSFVPKEFRWVFTNQAGNIEIPNGPIGDLNALYYSGDDDYSDNEIDDLTAVGGLFKSVTFPKDCNMTLDYSAGYGRPDTAPLPKRLKEAIMKEVLYRYEHRGDELEDDGICKAAIRLAQPFKRQSWL